MVTFSITLFFVNFLFLMLGAALYIFSAQKGIDIKGDMLFPTIAFEHLGPIAGVVFIIGLISALFPSADGALTSLTTAFSVDFLNIEKREDYNERKKTRIRHIIHVSFALVFVGVIIFYGHHQNDHLIDILYQVASITYGPLLGLFAFGLLTKRKAADRYIPIICIISPILCFILNVNSQAWFNYNFDFELLVLNGLITFLGILMLSKKEKAVKY